MPAGEARLGDAVMAFFVGPQINEGGGPGYVILVNADGSLRALRTRGMDMMRMAWSRHGLYFADKSADYRLTASGLTTTANPKSAAQNLMFALPDGGAVGVYNGGDVTEVAADGHRYDAQGTYFTGARCDGQVYGIAENAGAHRSQAPTSAGWKSTVSDTFTPQMLARLHPAEGGEKVIGWRQSFGGTPPGEVPCHDGVITFLSWDADAYGTSRAKVVSWDTATGESTSHPLTFEAGVHLNAEDFGYVHQGWKDGRLHWVYADGRVFSTDSGTGKTTTLFANAPATGAGRPIQTFYAFTDTELHALSTVREAEGSLTYRVLDRATGETLREVAVAIPHTEVNVQGLNLSHLAVPPAAGQHATPAGRPPRTGASPARSR
ncbi:hypothetical protein AB0F81_30870 [Actinoplanes sp. NPDC024001]|uniref:hypothetical protein n=1 Tax=Actinoplanes sp. NPDC024001 TaxID=3154598 RepID=UPI0033EA884B